MGEEEKNWKTKWDSRCFWKNPQVEQTKTKLGNYCILCTVQKNSRKISIKVWLTLFKNGNNLYEHWE